MAKLRSFTNVAIFGLVEGSGEGEGCGGKKLFLEFDKNLKSDTLCENWGLPGHTHCFFFKIMIFLPIFQLFGKSAYKWPKKINF